MLVVAFILVVVINEVRQLPPFTYTLLVGGIGTTATGLALKFRPLTGGGMLLLACTVLSLFVSDTAKPLLQGIAVIPGYLVPGYLLKYTKE